VKELPVDKRKQAKNQRGAETKTSQLGKPVEERQCKERGETREEISLSQAIQMLTLLSTMGSLSDKNMNKESE
jgi:hypothetical protein